MILAVLRRVESLAVVFLALTTGVSAQDLLQVFLNGGTEGRLTGGDPFVGWEQNWGGAFNHWGSQGFIRYKGRVDNYYREERNDGTSPGLGGVLHAFEAAIPLSAGTVVGIDAESETVLSQALNTRDQIATYDNSRKKVRLTVDTELSGRIRWKVVAGHVTNSGSFLRDMGTGLTLATRYGNASLGVERSTNGQHMALTVGGVSGYLPLEHEHVITRLSFRTEGPFSLELGASRSVISRKVDGPSFRQMQFEPAGILAAYNARFLWRISSNWKAMGALESQSMSGHGEFTSEGSRYGAVNGIRYGELSLLAALERTAESGLRFIADVRWRSIRGSLEGFLDSWPFVSLVESPVSARAMFRINGSFQIIQAHGGASFFAADWLEVGGGISALRILPDLRVETWQTGFLGVGIKSYADRRLAVRSLDGAMLSGGLRFFLKRIRLEYAVSQFVPVRMVQSTLPEGTANLVSGAAAGTVVRSWGGFFQQFSAGWNF